MTKQSEIGQYTKDIENLFIQFFLSDPELFIRCLGIIDGDHYIDSTNRKAVTFIKDYAQKYTALPTREVIKSVVGFEVDLLTSCGEAEKEWFLTEYELFARHKALANAIYVAPDLLAEHRYGEVEAMIKNAVSIGLVKDLGLNYFENPLQRLEDVANGRGAIGLGFRDVDDKLYGGVNRGEITIIAGQSGAGKSVFLQNFAVNWALAGLNVVYLSLELSEKLCAMRIDAMFTDYGTRDVLKNREDVDLKLRTIKKKAGGTLQIKQMKNGSTANDIRAYIKEYEIQTGQKVDAILLDYIDLCMPTNLKISPENLFVKDKYVTENMRDLAVELDVICVSASQLNRCLDLNTEVEIADKGLMPIKDVVIGDRIKSNTGYNTITDVFPISKQHAYKIRTASGREIICSAEHIFPTTNGENKISNGMKVGDYLFIKNDTLSKNELVENILLEDEIVSIEYIGEIETIDIETDGNHLFYANGVLTHNSSHEHGDGGTYTHANIAGGISKINTADNVLAIYVTSAMKENGRYQLQFLKTRSSAGVGSRVDLGFKTNSLRIYDLDEDDVGSIQMQTNAVLENLTRQKSIKEEIEDDEDEVSLEERKARQTKEAAGVLRDIMVKIGK